MLGSNVVVTLLIVGAAGMAGSACSASSAGASPGTSTPDASTPDTSSPVESGVPEAASPSGSLTLTWNVTAPALTDGGVPGDAGAPGEAGVFDAGDAGDGSAAAVPVVGATVCVYQMPSVACVTTDATGLFTLHGLPATTNLPLSITMDGLRPELVPIQTASTDMDGTARPIGLQRIQSNLTGPDPVDWVHDGVATFFAIAPLPGSQLMFGGDPGASVTIAPAAGDGPYYLNDDGTYATGATALVATAGVYANLAPGTYTMTLDDPRHDCAPILTPFAGYGYPAGALSVQFPAVAGYITGPVGFFCTASTALVDAGQ